MNESLVKALHSAQFMRDDLQVAFSQGDAVTALVLYPMLEQAVKLQQAIEALISARNAD